MQIRDPRLARPRLGGHANPSPATSAIHYQICHCFKDLCLLLETGAPIMPMFYHVRPQRRRRIQKGEYASAFDIHEKKRRLFNFQAVSAWKSALQKVSCVSGLGLRDPNKVNGDEGQLLKTLEDTVFQYLKPLPLEMATDPVELGEAIGDFESFMESEQQNENEKVKIVGFGGSGKTTLSKEFVDGRRLLFERSRFLFDLRDASNRNALPDLQSKLLQDLLHVKDCEIDSVSEGKGIIRETLQSSTPRVFIVLDDIDHLNQVEAALVKVVMGSGSLIIVTSRDEGALEPSEADPIYKIKQLSVKHAQYLFCKRTFQRFYPMRGFEKLVEMFCERCGGLPLFLKVMGEHPRVSANNDRDQWEDELKYISNDILGY